MTKGYVTRSSWAGWRNLTPARLALGRVGSGMPTDEVLRFSWAHAMARDAIHTPLDTKSLEQDLRSHGWKVLQVRSRAGDRATYLRRPDLGRLLDPSDMEVLGNASAIQRDICIVIGDGLSSMAVAHHAVPLLEALRYILAVNWNERRLSLLVRRGWRWPTTSRMRSRPDLRSCWSASGRGLSSPDSLGIYMTHSPFPGRTDAERNCISNIRPEGLSYAAAAFKLAWLVRESLRRGLAGVDLKDESDLALLSMTGVVLQNSNA